MSLEEEGGDERMTFHEYSLYCKHVKYDYRLYLRHIKIFDTEGCEFGFRFLVLKAVGQVLSLLPLRKGS